MTRRDYISLAEALKACNPEPLSESPDYNRGVATVANEIAWSISRTDPKFDRERFLKNAGVRT